MENTIKRPLRIGMISTGDEIMQGSIVDTNAAWLANCLTEQGFDMVWRASVGDQKQHLIQIMQQASEWCDLVVVNGGLGPTTDDLSAEAAADFIGQPLVLFDAWKQVLQARYAHRFKGGLSASNLKQAMLPQGAVIIDNPKGSACGFEIEKNATKYWFTPGVPMEFKAMVEQQLLPKIQHLSGGSKRQQVVRWHTFGQGEAQVNEWLKVISLPEGFRFGYRALMSQLEVKLFCPEQDQQLNTLIQQVEQKLADFLFCRQETSFAQQILHLMSEKGATLATAESCTGGLLASELIAIAGSSAYFERGFITYTNQAKQDELGVSAATLETHGAVSLEVAAEMAQGARRAAASQLALATSGIAGPDGGTQSKPVGTVAIALATEQASYVQLFKLSNRGRDFIREMTAKIAMDMLRRHLQALPVFAEYMFQPVASVVIPTGE